MSTLRHGTQPGPGGRDAHARAAIIGRRTAESAAPAAAAVAADRERPHWVTRWAFYGFVASIPFEFPDRTIPLEVTTITGAVLLLTTLLHPRRCYARPPAALWCFAVFPYVFWVSFAFGGGGYFNEALKSFVTFLQLVLIFWAASTLMRDPAVATRALLALGLACVGLAALTASGAVNVDPDWVKDSGRVTMFGQNANRAGITLASGAIALLGLAYGRRRVFRPRLLALPLIALIVLAMLQGGSRGSLLALTIGLWTFTISGATLLIKLRNTVMTLLGVSLLVLAGSQLPLIRSRFERAKNLDLAEREQIFPAALGMFVERPLTGWGPGQNKYELASRLPAQDHLRRDAHNLVLEILTSTGLLGSIPFLLGTALCVWGAWQARRGAYGGLPFALAAALLTANMSSNYIAFKLHWVVMALGAAAGAASRRTQPGPARAPARPFAPLMARRVPPC